MKSFSIIYLFTIFEVIFFVKSTFVYIFADLQDHGEDTEEVTAVGAAAGVEMATAVVARWPEAAVAKEVAASEAVVDAEVAVHLTKTYTLFCPPIFLDDPLMPPKKPKPHEPSLDARSLFCMRDAMMPLMSFEEEKKIVKSK